MKHFIVATAGHVDHGKSTLVRALTGTDPDRLPEEKARGITIDLGFAHLPMPGLEVGIVDVPGHEDFVKNMVAGVGSVDVTLFVVAADDGWMPQTEEHLQILTHLGVTRAVVALTKIDLVDDRNAAVAGVRARLGGSPFADAPIVPTAASKGQGVTELRDALAAVLADAPPPRDAHKPKLPVDRVFALRGIGTVVTGTLTGGTLRRGQAVVMQPSGRTAHVRSVQNHGRETELGRPGTRTALNLPEVPAAGDGAARRGAVVTLPELGEPSRTLDVLLTRSDRAAAEPPGVGSSRPLRNGKTVQMHLGSGHWTARVNLLERGELLPGGRSVARLRCEAPVFAFAGERFILRDGSGRRTLAGGIILDPEAGRQRRFRRGGQRRFLERLTAQEEPDRVAVQSSTAHHLTHPVPTPVDAALSTTLMATLERDAILPRASLLRRTLFSPAEIAAAVEQLAAKGVAAEVGSFVADAGWWRARREQAAALIDAEHWRHPERIGLPLAHLRAGLGDGRLETGLLEELLVAFTSRGEFIQVGASIRRASHRPTLPAHLRAAGARLRAELARKPFEPPGRKLLAPDGPSRQALRFLFDTGEAVEFGEEIVLLEESFRRMRTIIARTLRAAGPSTTSDLRAVLGTTRRVLIPVLERLDRDGLTRREGDRRALR